MLVVAGPPRARAVDALADFTYVRKATRAATRKATLANYPTPDPRLESWLDYQLDSDFPRSAEDRYYRILTLPIPQDMVLEVSGLERTDDGNLVVCTRWGDIYRIENAFETPPWRAEFKLFASGLHQPLGLAKRNGWLYVTQRCEVTRIKDLDGDGQADLFETVADGWGLTGDMHEYAFGSKFDRQGNLWVVLCLTGATTSDSLFRGWVLRITPDGQVLPTCSGIRSPGGIGMDCDGEMFVTDNQGVWNGTNGLKHAKPGAFLGSPPSHKWYSVTDAIGPRPAEPKDGGRMHIEAKRIPQLLPPAVLFPYVKVGQSASGIVCDSTGGTFGPFAGQIFVSDQTLSNIARVTLEKVKGRYQGACYPFRDGFASGNLAMLMTDDGSLFVSGTDRGWVARGGKEFALQRLVWTGVTPFEVHEMRARQNGFVLTFTKPVDPATVRELSSYTISTYTYIYRQAYGSPEVDGTTPVIRHVTVADDNRSARLVVDGLQEGHVHELHMPGVRSATGEPLLHDVAYYTMNQIPEAEVK
ncbi:MAG: hypothetical protein ACC645_18950 [Pirellulales bacterium]